MAQAKIRMIEGRRAGYASLPAFTAPQKSSATFVAGAPVKLSSGVLVATSTTNAASSTTTYVSKSSASSIIGIAMGTATSGATADIVVARIAKGVEFEGNLVHKSASSAKVSKVGSTVYIGKDKSSDTHYGFSLSAPGASSSAYVQGIITDLVDPASTVNGRVLATLTTGGKLA